MKNQILLLEDVDGLGRKGEIVSARPGYIRNFLLPQQKGVIAEKHLVRLQERLKEEREKQAVKDKKDSEVLAEQLVGKKLHVEVKIDAEGNMYGSVTPQDIVQLMKDQLDFAIEKRNVVLSRPIKKLGLYDIILRLKEGVPAEVILEVTAEEKPSLPA